MISPIENVRFVERPYRAEEEVEMPIDHRYSACLYLNKQLTFHKSGNDSLSLTVNLFCKLEDAPEGTYGVLFDHRENKALRHCEKSLAKRLSESRR